MARSIKAVLTALCVSAVMLTACGTVNSAGDEKEAQSNVQYMQNELDYANGMAKSSYNAIVDYAFGRLTADNTPTDDTIASFIGKEIDCSGERPSDAGEAAIWDWLGGEGQVIVISGEIDGINDFAVQWRSSSDTDTIGQYPQAVDPAKSGQMIWGVFMPGNEKTAD